MSDSDWQMFHDIVSINKWLDNSNPKSEHEDSMRVLKIGEELGEAVQAYIGMTGQNPRKGVTHTEADLCMELCDVAITALCALAHFTYNPTQSETNHVSVMRGYMASKISQIMIRGVNE